jgi:uncharacterized membrane protein YqhA
MNQLIYAILSKYLLTSMMLSTIIMIISVIFFQVFLNPSSEPTAPISVVIPILFSFSTPSLI